MEPPCRKVTILRGPHCPHAAAAADAVRALAGDLGIAVVIEEVVVRNDEDARTLRCLGSPTILIGDRDIEPRARGATSFAPT